MKRKEASSSSTYKSAKKLKQVEQNQQKQIEEENLSSKKKKKSTKTITTTTTKSSTSSTPNTLSYLNQPLIQRQKKLRMPTMVYSAKNWAFPSPSSSTLPPLPPLPRGCRVAQRNLDPPLLVLDDFLTPKEVEKMMEIARERVGQFRASPQDDGGRRLSKAEVAAAQQRTSRSLFLPRNVAGGIRCVERKVAALLGLVEPSAHLEPLQIVTYKNGARFDLHHDSGTYDEDAKTVAAASPLRLFTLLIYLNDVKEGGATVFPATRPRRLCVQPRAGRAVLWPNVDSDGHCTSTTVHYAEAVDGEEQKWAINCWVTEKRFV